MRIRIGRLAFVALSGLAACASPARASLTLLSGPQQGTHAGNLVVNGSFETGAPAPNAFGQFWASGTTSTPFGVPTGWTSTGGGSNYARWYSTGSGPYQTNFSDNLPDGQSGLYFGNYTTTIDQPPTWHPNGTVTFPAAPNFSPVYGQPVVLSQTVPTHLNPSPSYILSFWVSGEDASNSQWVDGLFGLRVTNVLAGDPIRYLACPGGQSALGASIRYEYQFTPLNPLAPVTIEFYNWGHVNQWTDPSSGGTVQTFTTELVLDDVIVNMVPGPGGLGVLVVAGVAGLRRRRP
jgi:hypothetical protein